MAIRQQSRTHGRFTRISSTCISNINYEPIEGTLDITFHNPTIGKWRYFSVNAFDAAALLESGSRGEYFNAYIKGVYSYERIE